MIMSEPTSSIALDMKTQIKRLGGRHHRQGRRRKQQGYPTDATSDSTTMRSVEGSNNTDDPTLYEGQASSPSTTTTATAATHRNSATSKMGTNIHQRAQSKPRHKRRKLEDTGLNYRHSNGRFVVDFAGLMMMVMIVKTMMIHILLTHQQCMALSTLLD